jgi:sec-independent protein translocase protein TatA
MPNLRGSEWLIIVLLVVLLFGAKRLPDAARSIGRSLRIFKAETKGLAEGPTAPDAPPSTATAAAAEATPPAPPAPAELPAAAGGSEPTSALQPQFDESPGALQPRPPAQA